jgi:hypothetical protein
VHNSGSIRTPVCRATASAQVLIAARTSVHFASDIFGNGYAKTGLPGVRDPLGARRG